MAAVVFPHPASPTTQGDVLVQLGICQYKSNILECLAFMQCPVFKAKTDLRGNTDKHIIGNTDVLAV